ncbi:hypothetical protein ABI125_00045 [Tamlana crocina]
MKTILPFLLFLFGGFLYSQTTFSGSVVDDSGSLFPVPMLLLLELPPERLPILMATLL